MGTAVLLPQDCLRVRSRHKQVSSGMIYAPGCAPRSKRTLLGPVEYQEAGLLPVPGHGRPSPPMNIAGRGSGADHFKFRKSVERREREIFSKVMHDGPVYKLLQRPKQGNSAVKLLAPFEMVGDVKVREFHYVENASDGLRYEGRGNMVGSACARKRVNEMHTSAAEGYMLPNMKAGASKPKVAATGKVHGVPDDCGEPPSPLKLSARTAGKLKNAPCKTGTERGSGSHESMFPKLRRTSTEPQIPIGPYRSRLIRISQSQSVLSENAPFSCRERWAGPAYASSPSPSSLPLPKLCLPHTRFSSLEISPLVKQYSTGVYMQPFLGSSAPSENGGARDIALATKSLRKMLHLDAC